MIDEQVDQNPDRVFLTKTAPPGLYERVIDMCFKQGLSTVLLVIAAYVFYSKIPEHIKAIVDGNAAIAKADNDVHRELQLRFEAMKAEDDKRHSEQVKYLADRHVEVEESIVKSFDRSQDLLEEMIQQKTNALGSRVDEIDRKIDNSGVN